MNRIGVTPAHRNLQDANSGSRVKRHLAMLNSAPLDWRNASTPAAPFMASRGCR